MDTNDVTEVSMEAQREGEAFEPAPFRPTRRRLAWSAGAATAFFAGLVTVGIVPRVLHGSAMAAEEHAEEQTPARMTVVRAERSAEASRLVLPGS